MATLLSIDKFIGGLHSNNITSEVQLDPADATDILNVEYYPRGAISKRGGYSTYIMSSAPITGVMAIFPWKDSSFNNVTLIYTATSGANVSADVYTIDISGGTATPTKQLSGILCSAGQWAPTLSAHEVHVVSYAGSAISVGGAGAVHPVVYNPTFGRAASWVGLISGAKHVAAWGQYLFFGNVLDSVTGATRKRSRVVWNSNGSITNWPSTYYIDLDPDDGDEITGMKLLSDYLVVFKKNKIFVIYWVGGSTLFQQQRRASNTGCIAGRTIVEKEHKLYFLADDGFYSFDGTNIEELSKKVKDKVIENIDQANPWIHHGEVYESHRQIWFGVGMKAQGDSWESLEDYQKYCNRVFVYDWELRNWTLFDIPSTAFGNVLQSYDDYWYNLTSDYPSITRTIGSYAGTESPELLIGHADYSAIPALNASGKLSCLSVFGDYASDVTSTGIEAYWQSIWFDMGEPIINKRFTRWTLIANQESTTDAVGLTSELHENYDPTTYLLDDGSASSFSSYLTGAMTHNDYPMEIRLDTSRTCRAFQIKVSNEEPNQTFTIHKMVVEGMPKGRTKV